MPFLDTLRLFPTIPQSWWHTEMLESGQSSKMCLVVRVWLILVGSNWNIKLGYLSDITLVLWWRGTFERMISTFWASKGWFRPVEPFALTFSHVTVRLASQLTAIPGFFAYDYDTVCAYSQCSCTSTETSLREKRFQDILSRMMSVSSCVEIPPSARVYPCRHATAISIVVMCVDNNELKTMAKRTCTRLDFSLKA